MCPYYLDGDRGIPAGFPWRNLTVSPGLPTDDSHSEKSVRISPKVNAARRLPDTRYIGYCAVFKVREEVELTA